MKRIILMLILSPLLAFSQKTIIHCGKLIDVKSLQVLTNISIVVEGKKISAIVPGYQDGAKGDQVINLKNKTNENQMVSVEFKEKIASNTFSGFKDCISIKEIRQNKFNFETNKAESIRKQIMEFCLSNNLNIVSLNSESHNLESVFKSLTL
jgi:hypothetical protein